MLLICFSSPGSPHTPMYSVCDNHLMMAGFPHSDISGSKSVCRLPEAFRRLPRLSSPLTAKASTVCASSLDHITPSRSEEHTSELQSLMRISYAVFCLKKKQQQ